MACATATSRGARASPTRSAPSSTSRASPPPSSGTPAGSAPSRHRTRWTRGAGSTTSGENGDGSVDALISDNLRDLIALFRRLAQCQGQSFATKYVNRDLLAYDPQGKHAHPLQPDAAPARERSMSAPRRSSERIAAIDDFVAGGCEVHLNFSPVVLLRGLDSPTIRRAVPGGRRRPLSAAKAQLAAEVIFLTHNDRPARRQPGMAPEGGRDALGAPPPGNEGLRDRQANLRYRAALKARMVRMFLEHDYRAPAMVPG